MGLFRWVLVGATAFGAYRLWRRPPTQTRHELDGLCATFPTREGADLAVEHLVQEYGIDRAFIYVEPIDAENSSGIRASGGDEASAERGHGTRADAPLHGMIQLTVPVERNQLAVLRQALEDTGASQVEVF